MKKYENSSSRNLESDEVINHSIIFGKRNFLEHLHKEKLRAQRADSPLSFLLFTVNNSQNVHLTHINEILKNVRSNTRSIDILSLVNYKTIGVILPNTNEKGAKQICEKIVNSNSNSTFSITSATYPDQLFESISENGYIEQDAYPFDYVSLKEHSSFQLSIKRAIDIVGSISGMLILMPLMLLVALIIKLTSPGPVIFKQIRLGKQGIPFTFYKFRSMYADTDDQIHRDYITDFISGHHEKINQGNGEEPIYKMTSDPRITKIGAFIRKTSIDELPQLFNVLIGDMSLVGPRPPLAYEVEKYQPWHLKRLLDMKPGITGLWQVEGRSSTEWDDAVRLDIRYIQNWSLLQDFKILIKTVLEIFHCKGAM